MRSIFLVLLVFGPAVAAAQLPDRMAASEGAALLEPLFRAYGVPQSSDAFNDWFSASRMGRECSAVRCSFTYPATTPENCKRVGAFAQVFIYTLGATGRGPAERPFTVTCPGYVFERKADKAVSLTDRRTGRVVWRLT